LNIYQKISVVFGLGLYLPLAWQVITPNSKHKVNQNITSFILWFLLDLVGSWTMYQEHGNYQLSLAYAVGCAGITLCLLKRHTKFKFEKYEKITSIAVLITVVVWLVNGPMYAIVCTSFGVVVSSIPQIEDAARLPEEMPFVISVCYFFVNLLSILGGQDWSIEERLIPFVNMMVSIVLSVLSARKYFRKQNPVTQ
jgi:hypothetical protein